MSLNNLESSRRTRVLVASIVGAALLAGAFIVSSSNDAQAEPAVLAKKKTEVLGAIGKLPEPQCPMNCEALAIVSGFQAEIDDVGNPYRIPYNGFITKWKLSLGSVDKEQRTFFEENFGSKPKAQLSVLKPVKVNGRRQYKLQRRSPVVGLNKYLGKVASIGLDKRIPVKKGWYVALTVATWAPALAFVETKSGNPDPDFNWRASREKNTCDKKPNMNTSEPQQKVNSKRSYGCRFDGAQLLYRVKVTNK